MEAGKFFLKCSILLHWAIALFLLCGSCAPDSKGKLKPKISMVNSPTDVITQGGYFMARAIKEKSDGEIDPRVHHSGVLSGGKGVAEIEMCQQGSIEMHITSTAYLANLVPKASAVSLPFLFRDFQQVVDFVKSKSPVLDTINNELRSKNLYIIAWWPRGFRQLTNSKRPIKKFEDIQGLKFRVMNNQLFVDNMNAMGANPVPMEWGEVYNGLQLNTIDGQENAEDVIFSSRLYEAQRYMTIWDYSMDLEVVLVNLDWWSSLSDEQRTVIGEVADASVDFQAELLKKNTEDLRDKIEENGMEIYYMESNDKAAFKEAVKPVWTKYEKVFSKPYLDAFMAEVEKY